MEVVKKACSGAWDRWCDESRKKGAPATSRGAPRSAAPLRSERSLAASPAGLSRRQGLLASGFLRLL